MLLNTQSNMSIGIVGGGISGLYAALLLRREGHKVTLFEASDRLGGRIYTHHFAPLHDGEEPYFEAGAMRIPRSYLHRRVYHMIRYLNTHGDRENKVELIPYILQHENNKSFVRGQRATTADSRNISGFNLPKAFQGKSAMELLHEVVGPWIGSLRADFDRGFEKLLAYDELSFRQYLRFIVGWPHEVVEYVELMSSQTNQYDLSFTEIMMQNLDFDTKNWTTIRGGMSRLPDSAAKLLDERDIYLNSRVVSIVESPNGRIAMKTSGAVPHAEEFDKVILAIPPSALNHIVERPGWPFMKEQFIRGAHFEPLYKIGLHFRARFWERSACPSFGGQSVTDLRFRWIVYPSNDIGSKGSGILLLYCWMTDAARWMSMPSEERINLALHDLQIFFSDANVDVRKEFISAFDISWSCENATGDAMFLPGQFSRFHHNASVAEGNVYFAGEHLSKHHTWIAGAIDSALSTVTALLGQKDLAALGEEHLKLMEQKYNRRTEGRFGNWAYAIPHHNNLQYVNETSMVGMVKA